MMKLISWSWIMMQLISKKAWKKKKGTSIAWYIICKIYSYQKICTIWFFVVSDEVTSTNSQIFEQIEVIPGVVLTRMSKLNDSVPEKKQGDTERNRKLC